MNTILLKDAERVVRITMIVILLTAGTSKFFSHGGFLEYYCALFQGDLRITLPRLLVDRISSGGWKRTLLMNVNQCPLLAVSRRSLTLGFNS